MSGVLNLLLAGAASAIKDAYFNLTTLLLNTSSTNGAQNNTFLDSSTNTFTITRNGNTTQGTFTPFSQTGWSNYQSAVDTNYLNFTTSPGTLFQFAGDFTIESWIFPTALTVDASIWVTNDGSANYFAWNIDSTNFSVYLNSSGATSSFAHGVSLNQWSHVAMVRSGSTITVYTNGVSKGTLTSSATLGYSSPSIARNGGGGTSGQTRYQSNLRIVKSAVYTSAFTPPTTPLTNIANTSLLTCQSNRFVDNSSNALVATVTGTPSVQAFSPFLPTTAYDTAVVGGSGYFDGTGDYLSLAATSAFAWGTGDITIECWLYLISTGSDNGVWDFRTGDSGQLFLVSNSLTSLQLYVGGASAYSFSINPNAWNHIAVVRNSGTLKTYLNGVQVGSVANTTNFTATAGCNICSFFNGTQVIGAYISNFRAVKGTAVYTAAFTPPTAPLTAITNTSLLLSATNAGIFDSAAKNVLETVGNAQVSTTQAKWGTTSMYFDGAGDALLPPTSKLLAFNAGDFTAEVWIYPIAWDSNMIVMQGGNNGFGIQKYSSGSSGNIGVIINGSWVITDATLPTTGQWTHIAVTRSSSTLRFFVNGVVSGSTPTNTADISDGIKNIGGESGQTFYYGYMDDLRVTKGYARYTANFTPPAAAFPLQ